MMEFEKKLKCEIWNDSMQNWKSKPIQKAQLIIADVPYNVGTNFYGSNPVWYKGGTTRGILEKCNDSFYVLNVLEVTAVWDGVECDGFCLLDDINYFFEEFEV